METHNETPSPQVTPPSAASQKWPIPSASIEEVTSGALFFLAAAIAVALLIAMMAD